MRVNEATGGLRYFAIADEIRRRIVSGHYSFGTALPSQSALAKEFATTVMTVRQALKTLESEGAPGDASRNWEFRDRSQRGS
jgi:DNA-binding GntR family transcriptional regulator